MLWRQLQNLPALSGEDEAQLTDIVARRIETLEPETRARLYGDVEVGHRAWSIADYLILHVGPSTALGAAEGLFEVSGRPFPGLLAVRGEPAVIRLGARQRGAIVRPRHFEVTEGAALWLEPNGAAVVERPAVSVASDAAETVQWAFDGALYILRRGGEITELWAFDMLDLLVARHVQEAR
jgi:hypothetical protein